MSSQTEQILSEIVTKTDEATQNLQARSRRVQADIETIEGISAAIDDAVKIKDEVRRGERIRILTSTLEQTRSDAIKEERDLAAAVFGINAQIETLGKEYEGLKTLSPAEQGLIDDAKAEVSAAEAGLAKAQSAWFFRGSKIQKANDRIAVARAMVQEAEAEAGRRQRDRLMSANMEASLLEIQVRATRTVEIMKKRRVEIIRQLDATKLKRQQLMDDMTKAAAAVEKFDVAIDKKEAELQAAEQHLATMENGTDEHAAQSRVVADARADLEELIGGRNVAVAKHQSDDKFSTELAIHEQTHTRLRDNLMMWITVLENDTAARVVTSRSRLEAMKAASDQEVAKSIDDLGAETDRRNAAAMAAMGAASDRARVERFRKQPELIREITDIAVAQIDARQKVESDMADLIAEFRNRYGIDPMATSIFTDARQLESEGANS